MPPSFDKERQAIAEEEAKLADRKRKLEQREREVVTKALDRSGLLKLAPDRAKAIFELMRKLGPEEVERRLSQ